MNTRINFNRPVNIPIYQIRKSILEATLKANQGASKEVLAEEIFHVLQSRGLLPCEANFEDYKEKIIGVIKDRDNDGHYDVDIHELNEAIRANFTSSPNSEDPINALQSSPLFEAYFKDQVSISSQPQLPSVSNTVGNPSLRTMSFSEALRYFKDTYRHGAWNEAKQKQFINDLQLFMDTHFTATPVETEEEATNAVADNLPPVSDDLFAQMSKDGQGRVRVDCGVYAEIYKRIFESAGLNTFYNYVVIETSSGGLAGHLVTCGVKGNLGIIGNNERINLVSNLKGPDQIDQIIVKDSKDLGKVLGIFPAKTIEEGQRLANSKIGFLLRYFNSAILTGGRNIENIMKVISKRDSELIKIIENNILRKGIYTLNAQQYLNTQKTNILNDIQNAIRDMEQVVKYASTMPNNVSITFRGVSLERSEVSTFAQNFNFILSLSQKMINSPDRTLTLNTDEYQKLKAARNYFSRFNISENDQHYLYVLANFLLGAASKA